VTACSFCSSLDFFNFLDFFKFSDDAAVIVILVAETESTLKKKRTLVLDEKKKKKTFSLVLLSELWYLLQCVLIVVQLSWGVMGVKVQEPEQPVTQLLRKNLAQMEPGLREQPVLVV
jgi:hypothetical protein